MNPYDVLGFINKEVTQDEIKVKYRELSKIHHPDVGGNASQFAQINVAYKILSNPEKKEQYDRDGYIEPDEMYLKQQVRSRIIRIVEDWSDKSIKGEINVSIIRFFNIQITGGRKHINDTIAHLKKARKLMKTCFKQLSYDNKQDSVVHVILQQKIHLLKADIHNSQSEIQIIELLAEELKKYLYEEESEFENTTMHLANGSTVRFF